MRLAEHLTALRTWCEQCLAWLVKTRRAPSRHSRGARVYGHTTSAMHKLITPSPPPPFRNPNRRESNNRHSSPRPRYVHATIFFCARTFQHILPASTLVILCKITRVALGGTPSCENRPHHSVLKYKDRFGINISTKRYLHLHPE